MKVKSLGDVQHTHPWVVVPKGNFSLPQMGVLPDQCAVVATGQKKDAVRSIMCVYCVSRQDADAVVAFFGGKATTKKALTYQPKSWKGVPHSVKEGKEKRIEKVWETTIHAIEYSLEKEKILSDEYLASYMAGEEVD